MQYCIGLIEGIVPLTKSNQTLIILVPKIKGLHNMTYFRPISLCNVLYKIASKAVVNRFQEVLHLYVDEAQSAFVFGQLIILLLRMKFWIP